MQVWVEFTVVRVRLFLMNSYLAVIAWRHPPVAASEMKSGGSDFSKPPLVASILGMKTNLSNSVFFFSAAGQIWDALLTFGIAIV
ncbi:MAG: hypothetical protein HDT26_12265 [Subdoligranulum sp.]|nr:hypothetical protein [Subdoligranulum sp.]